MVELHLAKVDVEGSNPFARSIFLSPMKASVFFDLPASIPFRDFFSPDAAPWEWLPQIQLALESFNFSGGKTKKDIPEGLRVSGNVFIDPTAKLPIYGVIEGPCFIGPKTELRPGVYIRGNVIVGANCVLGNSCEYKNCILMDNVQTPHFNYVGDSILGNGAHLGAGVILANLRLDHQDISVKTPYGRVPTALRKIGAIMGDYAEVGCNAVLQPGTLLGKKAMVGPTLAFGGYLEANKMALLAVDHKIYDRKEIQSASKV